MSYLTPIKLRMPADVLSDVDAVCPDRGRTRFIVAAVREKLAGEPAVQRAREAREAAIAAKAGTDEQLTPEEAAHWNHTRIEQAPTIEGPTRYIVNIGDEWHAVDKEDLKRLRGDGS